jgi:hypothetical protein
VCFLFLSSFFLWGVVVVKLCAWTTAFIVTCVSVINAVKPHQVRSLI